MKALKKLKELELQANRIKYPLVPEGCHGSVNYKHKTANGLTRCVIDWIKYHGGQAERISNTGRYIDGSKIVSDCMGFKRTIGSGKYIPGTGTNGTADISATIKGKSVKIEIKIEHDRQSEAQKIYQISIELAGGIYYICRDFDEFVEWYESIITM